MKKKFLATIFLFPAVITAMAQTPEMYPPPVPEPVELTLLNIIIYFVLPVAMIVFFIFYRRSKRKNRENNTSNRGQQDSN